MANQDYQVILHHDNGLPEDDFVNVLHFDSAYVTSPVDDCDAIAAAYTTLGNYLANYIGGMTIKVYDPGLNPGGPVFAKDYALSPGNPGAPAEVACCLSYATVDDPLASLPRRRGRIYIGPLANGYTNAERPGTVLRQAILDFGVALSQVRQAQQTVWKMYSKADNAYFPIESIWVDDAWDTQRRRGAKPTLRQVVNVT